MSQLLTTIYIVRLKNFQKQASGSEEIQDEFKKYRDFVKYAEEASEYKISKPREANRLFRNLRSSVSIHYLLINKLHYSYDDN